MKSKTVFGFHGAGSNLSMIKIRENKYFESTKVIKYISEDVFDCSQFQPGLNLCLNYSSNNELTLFSCDEKAQSFVFEKLKKLKSVCFNDDKTSICGFDSKSKEIQIVSINLCRCLAQKKLENVLYLSWKGCLIFCAFENSKYQILNSSTLETLDEFEMLVPFEKDESNKVFWISDSIICILSKNQNIEIFDISKKKCLWANSTFSNIFWWKSIFNQNGLLFVPEEKSVCTLVIPPFL